MQRYCTTCGQLTTLQNPSLYTCTLGHQNWINPAAASSVFIIQDNKVLYGVRSIDPGKGKLDLPGGFIEVGETAEQAAVREAKEEVGVDIELIEFLGSYATTYQGRPNLNFSFIARITGGIASAGDDMDPGKLVWRDIGNLPGPGEWAAEWFEQSHRDFKMKYL
jgi:ADP-ribose pyrophosphatase YjhB (NUDIX family)